MKSFGKTVCKIAIPVTIQCMLQSSFSIVDELMIGQLGSKSISAVGLGGNFSLIFSVVIGAVAAVAGIIIAQFLGARDEKESLRGFNVNLLVGIFIAALFMITSFFFTKNILSAYTKDTGIISEGIPYLRLISFTFIPMAVSSIVATWLRCREHAAIPLVASFAAVICNTGLNYVLIFGRFGFEAMGVKGAGIATVASQIFNMLFILIGFLYCNYREKVQYIFSVRLQKVSVREYIVMIYPILISEFLWSLGQNVFSGVYGHIGGESLAAYTLTTPIQGLMTGALSGLSAAAGVMIGKHLGKEDYENAYKDSRKLMFLGLYGALILSLILVFSARMYVGFYQVEDTVKSMAHLILIIFAIYAPVKVENMILGGGIIRSGGNTKIIMIIDSVGTWCVGIPLCFLAAYVFRFSMVGVYAILSFEEVFRLVITLVMFKKKTWMKSITV